MNLKSKLQPSIPLKKSGRRKKSDRQKQQQLEITVSGSSTMKENFIKVRQLMGATMITQS